MKLSANGIALIKHFEGCKLKAYKCPAGIWTIGYGATGPEIKEGMVITQQEADNLLFDHVERFERQVDSLKLPLKQCQFDALVSFSFNLGFGSLQKSTLLKKIKSGDYSAAALEFLKWNKAGGNVLAGLTRRRTAEMRLFNGEKIEAILS